MRYYIVETQHRADGEINLLPTVSRSTFAGGLNYFHERVSKMVVNEDFVSVSVLLVDDNLTHINNCHAYIHDGMVELS